MERLALVLTVALAAIACNPTSLKKGYCRTSSNCPDGMTCSKQLVCVEAMDASADSSEASDGGEVGEVGDAADAADVADARDGGDAEVPFRCRSNGDCTDGGANVCEKDAGMCVECLVDTDCTETTKPICNVTMQICERCTSDVQCASKVPNPGVCMFHQDGRCATDAETIYVRNSAGSCSGPSGGGTKESPYCNSQDGINAVMQGRSLVVMRGPDALTEWAVATPPATTITVVGQSAATVNPGARIGVRVSAGSVYVRDLKVSAGSNIGVIAETGADFTMDHCTVMGNAKGGILIDGAAFDIQNSTISGNGPSADLTWGGIRIQNLLATGSAQLRLLTIQTNNPSGVSCSAMVSGIGVSAIGNVSGEISQTCGFSSCGAPMMPTCGAF